MSNKQSPLIFKHIDDSKENMIQFMADIIRVPAIGPTSGGEGEQEKANVIEKKLVDYGFKHIRHFDAPDDRLKSKTRPNIQVTLKGKSSGQRIVLITHMDVVAPGAISEWTSDPFQLLEKDGKLFGRGTEDNGQSLTASIFALKAFIDLNIQPAADIVLFFVSEEEETNEKGIRHLIDKNLIQKSDLILVPDHGEPTGRLIDIVEKTILWVKVSIKGKQCHASIPNLGKNAFRASMQFGTMVDKALHEKFNVRDDSFDYPLSSFEPTKREPRASGINVLPGEEVFYFDCRLLPVYQTREILDEMKTIARTVEDKTGTTIQIEPVFIEETTNPTPPGAKIVKALSDAIYKVTKKQAINGGIGGGTCGAVLRKAGFEVAVWETIENRAHTPNEYAVIDNMVSDCKVFAQLFLTQNP
jgi:succinyl-diaminopimelate desuccinylase